MELYKLAQSFSNQGYSIIPVSNDKNPTIEIKNYDSRTDKNLKESFKNASGLALRTGGDTMVTCIDIDTKYCLTGDIHEKYYQKLPKQLLDKMKINKTRNGGIHLIFKSDYITSNSILASRVTTEEEVIQTFSENLQKGSSFKESVVAAAQDRQRVLVETRGGTKRDFGGYFLIPPSWGYEAVQNLPIPFLNDTETEMMYNAGFSLCQNRRMNRKMRVGKSFTESVDFKRFNELDGSIILKSFGWEETGREGGVVRLKRPGNVLSADSAIYNLDSGVFYCFSTSTSFIANEGYSNVDMLMELENTTDIRQVLPLIKDYLNI